MMSTYLGSITIVLKFPLTRAASTNGLQRYKGLGGGGGIGDGGRASAGNVAEVGVGDRLGRWARVMERPIVLKNDMGIAVLKQISPAEN